MERGHGEPSLLAVGAVAGLREGRRPEVAIVMLGAVDGDRPGGCPLGGYSRAAQMLVSLSSGSR